MNSEIYDDTMLERVTKEKFGVDLEIGQVIARQIEVSRMTTATVFLTKKKQLIVYIDGHSHLLLGDVKKIITRMGLKAEVFFPPKGQPDYFDVVGRDKFREVFPGREHIGEDDIVFYKTLSPYSPALVSISEVKNGEIYRYDSDARGSWRIATKFTYRRIKTS